MTEEDRLAQVETQLCKSGAELSRKSQGLFPASERNKDIVNIAPQEHPMKIVFSSGHPLFIKIIQ